MDKYVRVPVVDVHKDNIRQVWPSLLEAIRRASFVALDTELSGLGDKKKLLAKSIEDRYKNLVEVSKSRAILAVGISCFKEDSEAATFVQSEKTEAHNHGCRTSSGPVLVNYKVQTFNLSVLCSQDFVVEPGSVQFLIQHGFDFNKQFSMGISYHRGIDKDPPDFTSLTMRNIFSHLLLANKPIVLHNGLLDLVFMYQNFYNDLPAKLEMFTSDMFEIFPAGVLDTKYVAEFQLREHASYLGYIFRKCQRQNTSWKESSHKHVSVQFTDTGSSDPWVEYLCCNAKPKEVDDSSIQICDIYAAHGYCRRGPDCCLSHDIDHILDKGEKSQSSKRKRKNRKRKASSTVEDVNNSKRKEKLSEQEADNNSTENLETTVNMMIKLENFNQPSASPESANNPIDNSNTNVTAVGSGHRAGIDAFMTGYCLATYLAQCGVKGVTHSGWVNKISLSGKQVPLTISQSHFSKPSATHSQKMKLLRQNIFVNNE